MNKLTTMKNNKKKLAAKAGSSTNALRLSPVILEECESYASSSKLIPEILKCLDATVVSQQQRGLKTLAQTAGELTAEQLSTEPVDVIIKLFLAILFHREATHPLKRQVMQILSSLPTPFRESTVEMLASTFVDVNNVFTVDPATSVSLSLQHDFDLGTEAALRQADGVCALLSEQLKRLLSGLGDGSGEDQLATKRMLLILKTVSVLLMKDEGSISASTKRLVADDISAIMAIENLPIDCHTSAAICLLHLKRHDDPSVSHDFSFVERRLLTFAGGLKNEICIYYAFLSSWTIGSVNDDLDRDAFALHRIFDELNRIVSREKELNPGHLLLLSRCLLQWTKTAETLMNKLDDDRKPRCISDSQVTHLLQFVWSHWEHPMDCLRHQLEAIFVAVLGLVKKAGSQRNSFRSNLLETLMNGNYLLLLGAYVTIHGVSDVLEYDADFPRRLLKMVVDSSYACQVTKLYVNCLQALSSEAHDPWIVAISDSLIENDPSYGWILSTTIPKLIRFYPAVLTSLMGSLTRVPDLESPRRLHVLGALMKCLRLANKELMETSSDDLRTNQILRLSLNCSDEKIALEAFAFLTEVKKPSLPIPSPDLELVLEFLRRNNNSQSPSFRQSAFSLFSNFLISLCISSAHLERANTDDSKLRLREYKSFIASCVEIFVDGLGTSANYPRRTTSLNCLKNLFEYVWEDPVGKTIFPVSEFVQPSNHAFPIIKCLCDTYEDNMELALILLNKYFQLRVAAEPTFNLVPTRVAEEIWLDATNKLTSTKPQDSLSASYAIRFLIIIGEKTLESTLDYLAQSLADQIAVAEKDLVEAADRSPMYGTFVCLRHILWDEGVDVGSMTGRVHDLIQTCFRAAAQVGPIVSTSSPEGFMPESQREGLDVASVVTSQMLLLASWRTMKEVSLHLGTIVERCQEFLSSEIVEKIGNDFLDQMMMSKHRGAFEVGYEGFMKVTKVLMGSPKPELNDLPGKWMKNLLESSQNSEIVTNTRRSAGLPYCIVALLSAAQPRYSKKGAEIFLSTMESLLSSASLLLEISVHSLNILRMIVKDARFGDAVLPYIGDCFVTSIKGFSHANWMVHNSSTLLFSALMQRTFGVYGRSHLDDDDELPPPKKNCMTSLEFFTRFASMRPFILEILQTNDTIALNPSLFPVLLVMSRLLPSPQEERNGHDSLKHLIPDVLPCLSSAIMKTRSLAAKALVPLLDHDHVSALIDEILAGSPDANETHGKLLVIKYYSCREDLSAESPILPVLSKLIPFHESAGFGKNLMIQSVFWDVMRPLVAYRFGRKEMVEFIYKSVAQYLRIYAQNSVAYRHLPGLSYAVRSAAELFVKIFAGEKDESGMSLVNELLAENTDVEIVAAVARSLALAAIDGDIAKAAFPAVERAIRVNRRNRDCLNDLLGLAVTCVSVCDVEDVQPSMLSLALEICETTKSETVLETAISLTGLLISQVDVASPSLYAILRRFLPILDRTTDPEENGLVRGAAATAMARNKPRFLVTSNLLDTRLKFWMLCYDFSGAEERDVRFAIFDGLTVKNPDDILAEMVANLAVDEPWLCLDALIRTLTLSHHDDDEGKDVDNVPSSAPKDAQFIGAEQLFDKGERNTFAEERWEILGVAGAVKALWRNICSADPDAEAFRRSLNETFPVDNLARWSLSSSTTPMRCGGCANLEDMAQMVEKLKKFVVASEDCDSSTKLMEFLRNPLKSADEELELLRITECVNALCLR